MDVPSSRHFDEIRTVVLTHPPILYRIFSYLQKSDWDRLSTVTLIWKDVIEDVRWESVRFDSEYDLNEFEQDPKRFGRKIRTFGLTRQSLHLIPELPDLLPNIESLTIPVQSTASPILVIPHLSKLARLRNLTLLSTSRRRIFGSELDPSRLTDRILVALSDQELRLKSLKIISAPLQEESFGKSLMSLAQGLKELHLDGCGLPISFIESIYTHCPRLERLYFDADISRNPLTSFFPIFDRLKSLHFSHLPPLDDDYFLSVRHNESLRDVSFSHCPSLQSTDLDHFESMRSLRLVDCPKVDRIPTTKAGLEKLSILGSSISLTIGNYYELARHTEGGLRQIYLDSTTSHSSYSSFSHDEADAVRSSPNLDPLPSLFQPYRDLPLLSASLPTELLSFLITSSENLESISLFGTIQHPFPASELEISLFDREEAVLEFDERRRKRGRRYPGEVNDESCLRSHGENFGSQSIWNSLDGFGLGRGIWDWVSSWKSRNSDAGKVASTVDEDECEGDGVDTSELSRATMMNGQSRSRGGIDPSIRSTSRIRKGGKRLSDEEIGRLIRGSKSGNLCNIYV